MNLIICTKKPSPTCLNFLIAKKSVNRIKFYLRLTTINLQFNILIIIKNFKSNKFKKAFFKDDYSGIQPEHK